MYMCVYIYIYTHVYIYIYTHVYIIICYACMSNHIKSYDMILYYIIVCFIIPALVHRDSGSLRRRRDRSKGIVA